MPLLGQIKNAILAASFANSGRSEADLSVGLLPASGLEPIAPTSIVVEQKKIRPGGRYLMADGTISDSDDPNFVSPVYSYLDSPPPVCPLAPEYVDGFVGPRLPDRSI
jgi:hypothetical protein